MNNEAFRIQDVQSPIIPLVEQLISSTPGTISLGQGVVSYGPPPEAMEQLRTFFDNPDYHKYQSVHGIPHLLELIETKLLAENAINVKHGSRIVVTAGSNMAFVNAILAIAD